MDKYLIQFKYKNRDAVGSGRCFGDLSDITQKTIIKEEKIIRKRLKVFKVLILSISKIHKG